MEKNFEQRAKIKFCANSMAEMFEMVKPVYGESPVSFVTVKALAPLIYGGESFKDEGQSDRPGMKKMDANLAQIAAVVKEDH